MANKVLVRTKMASALIGAVREGGKQGLQMGKLGRLVLTNEAKGVGVRVVAKVPDTSGIPRDVRRREVMHLPKPPAVSAVAPIPRDAAGYMAMNNHATEKNPNDIMPVRANGFTGSKA